MNERKKERETDRKKERHTHTQAHTEGERVILNKDKWHVNIVSPLIIDVHWMTLVP